MLTTAHATTAEAIVDHLTRRFLSVPLAQKDRGVFIDFLHDRSTTSESDLRELLYLVLSAPAYQVN
jgi:hypothetical protein